MNAVVHAAPRFLASRLVGAGLPEAEACALVSVLRALSSNATRFCAAREVLRPLMGPTATGELLVDYGLWQREACGRPGCGRELGAKKAIVVIRRVGYCGVPCALLAIGATA